MKLEKEDSKSYKLKTEMRKYINHMRKIYRLEL